MTNKIYSNQYYETHNLFARNKRFYDAQRYTRIESDDEVKRRMPQTKSFASTLKFESSFSNSSEKLYDKVEKQIDKFKSRVLQPRCKSLFGQTEQMSESNLSPQKIKGIPMELYLPRRQIVEIPKVPIDERQFNNFKIGTPDLHKTTDLQKLTTRKESMALQHINDIVIDCNKAYEQFYHRNSYMKCLFQYKVQNSNAGRVFMKKRHKSDICVTQPDADKIAQGFQATSHYHSNNIDAFYQSSGRQLPSQLLMKQMAINQNYWIDPKTGKYIRPKVDFSIRVLKNALKQKKKEAMLASKHRPVQRHQGYDQYYFRKNN